MDNHKEPRVTEQEIDLDRLQVLADLLYKRDSFAISAEINEMVRVARQAAPEAPTKMSFNDFTGHLMRLADQQGADITLQYKNGTQMIVKAGAAPATQQADAPDEPTCRWPLCRPEAVQQQVAKEVHDALYGTPAATTASDLSPSELADIWSRITDGRKFTDNELAFARAVMKLKTAATTASASQRFDLTDYSKPIVYSNGTGFATAPSQEAAPLSKVLATLEELSKGAEIGKSEEWVNERASIILAAIAQQGAAQASQGTDEQSEVVPPFAAPASQHEAKFLPARRFVSIGGFWDADYVEFAEGHEHGGGVLNGKHHSKHYTRSEAECYVKEGAWREVAVPEQYEASRCRAQRTDKDNNENVAAQAAHAGAVDALSVAREVVRIVANDMRVPSRAADATKALAKIDAAIAASQPQKGSEV